MRTVFSSNSELCHIWAARKQTAGTANNMFFDGDTIYSYGRHFPIARHLPDGRVLVTTRGYSSSTGKHKSFVRYAINHLSVVYVYDISATATHNLDNFYKDEVLRLLKAASVATKNREVIMAQARRLYEEIANYAKLKKERVKGLKVLDNLTKNADLSPIKELVKREKEKEKRKKAAIAKLREKSIKDWKNNVPGVQKPYFLENPILRVNSGNVETSKGATVSIREAKILWRMIKAGKPVHGHNIEGFTVISLNGVLKIGCHEILRAEVDRIGAILESIE